MLKTSRRDFVKFLGGLGTLSALPACSVLVKTPPQPLLKPSKEDALLLAKGFNYKVLISEGTVIGKNLVFGTNNDFTQFIARKNSKNSFLWVNNEYFSPLLLSGRWGSDIPTKKQYENECSMVGGSLIEITQDPQGNWKFLGPSKDNKRLSGFSKIPFTEPIAGSKHAIGTFANCSGGLTPWNTILTCEENYENYYGEWEATGYNQGKVVYDSRSYKWYKVKQRDPRHYGWVVEFNPESGEAKKLIGLGRFAHECAKVVTHPKSKECCVVYSGDDRDNEHLYKFISKSPNSLDQGELFVADVDKGKWISLDINKQPELKEKFKTQVETLIRTREAAKMLKATPLARPEDIEQDPLTGDVFVALTNNKTKLDAHGSILKIKHKNNDHTLTDFKAETFLTGGRKSGISSPDNMAFDPNGNLWITNDMAGKLMHIGPYVGMGNNGLFVIPRRGPYAGQVLQVASAPTDAEFTGPCFSPDYKTLFLSVQHPGELTQKGGNYTSHWPHGGDSKPLSSVVTITGPGLTAFTLNG